MFRQFAQCSIGRHSSTQIILNCINNIIVCHTTLNHIVSFPKHFSTPIGHNKIEPFPIV